MKDRGVFLYQDGYVTIPRGPGLGIEGETKSMCESVLQSVIAGAIPFGGIRMAVWLNGNADGPVQAKMIAR